IFLAEMGDKTQLATMTLAAGHSRWTIFAGAAAALVATSAIGVLVGGGIAKVIPAIWIQRAAGLMFVVMGVAFLFGKGE
ncbi:MAG TPA: TMEM165/GDT1 family protein, partial [Anaeromyxobacteraceae bacterium]|nr:TMEM165/GDT1 family protein [Anaeromyxobacteraceae bacterium]